MVTVLLRRLLVLALVTAGVLGAGVAAPAQAAKPVRAAVEITAVQTAEESGNGFELTVLGTARGSNYVYVTIGEDPNVYDAYVLKGDWGTGLNPQPAGTLPICAEVRDAAGAVLARDCVDYTRPVDPVYFSVLSPAQDEEVPSTFTSVVGCHGGSTVRLSLDGVSEVLPCDDYAIYRRYVDLVEGSHTLTVEMLALDGVTVVASDTRTFTSGPIPVATVDITSPADGAVGSSTQVAVTGIATSNVEQVVRVYVDGAFTDSVTTAADGTWASTITLPLGTSRICAEMSDWLGNPLATDCLSYTVAIDPASLTIDTPASGAVTSTSVDVAGACYPSSRVALEVATQRADVACPDGTYAHTFDGVAGGEQTLTATMTYDGAEVAARSTTFVVDVVGPAAPVVTAPTTDTTITTRQVTLAGTAEPGSSVYVLWADGVYTGTQVGADGTFTVVLGEAYLQAAGVITGKRGTLTVTLLAEDQFGNRSATATYPFATRIR